MSTIDPTSPLLAQLRAEALAWRRKAGGPEDPGGVGRKGTTPSGRGDWLGQVAQAVATIRRDDPQRQRKAFRAYLHAVLARECGIEQPDNPAFQALIDRVQSTMEGDEQLRRAMATAGEMLLQTAEG